MLLATTSPIPRHRGAPILYPCSSVSSVSSVIQTAGAKAEPPFGTLGLSPCSALLSPSRRKSRYTEPIITPRCGPGRPVSFTPETPMSHPLLSDPEVRFQIDALAAVVERELGGYQAPAGDW